MPTDLAKWIFFDKIKHKVWKDFLKWYSGDYEDNELYNALRDLSDEINTQIKNWRKFELEEKF